MTDEKHDILTLEGYHRRILHHLERVAISRAPVKMAWELTEQELEMKYGEKMRRYSSYESFKSNRSKYLKKYLGDED